MGIKTTPGHILLRLSSLLMLFFALPMVWWCLSLINNAALAYDNAGIGSFGAAMLYVFSMLTAMAGMKWRWQSAGYCWCRMLAYVQLAVALVLVPLLGPYAVLTLPPLFILTILYLFGVGWRESKNLERTAKELEDGGKNE
ncbi:hypothetical protein ACM5Q9_01225 [Advenella sp. RU8]|uniref:hypothetical protein n=1 Tax=Advenella sp. RU8 TaxID=3399575 RepID=UPI003AAEBD5B